MGEQIDAKRLDVVGLGPGGVQGMTLEAQQALEACDVIVGYTSYIDLVKPLFPNKRYVQTPMRREIERCRLAFEQALAGNRVCLVCSGDSGVYGMASPVLELASEYPEVEIGIVPGVTAALAGAALLGAPLGNDFAIVSLSDLLTPWDVIERRLKGCALADMCIALYNPRSHGRPDNLRKAVSVLIETGASPQTACGWARLVGRDGQSSGVLTLLELADFEADMSTVVFVGSSQTYIANGRLVTPRGYRDSWRPGQQ